MAKYREMYWGLSKTFNPTKFDAAKWAEAAAGAGMKYFVMTTKHHDGFAMYVAKEPAAAYAPVCTRTAYVRRGNLVHDALTQ